MNQRILLAVVLIGLFSGQSFWTLGDEATPPATQNDAPKSPKDLDAQIRQLAKEIEAMEQEIQQRRKLLNKMLDRANKIKKYRLNNLEVTTGSKKTIQHAAHEKGGNLKFPVGVERAMMLDSFPANQRTLLPSVPRVVR